MANEYLQRTPTSTGNRKVWTFSFWIKNQQIPGTSGNIFYTTQNSAPYLSVGSFVGDYFRVVRNESASVTELNTVARYRDFSSWSNICIIWDTTLSTRSERTKAYINGVLVDLTGSYASQNYEGAIGRLVKHVIGAVEAASNITGFFNGELTDIFFIDGQALTPEVFGYYKDGEGYISAGSTQATDFRNGKWSPKKPQLIIDEINESGGFGVNGFYLPMNDSNNFGADFHCAPNSIIKLQENLPQPKAEIDGSGDYTGALRDDPFKQYLIYAQPNVSGGLQNGYGDYSHIIRGSGTPKVITGGAGGVSGTPTISTTQSLYYGSSLYFDGNDTINVETNDSNYLGRDFTIEFWVWHDPAYPVSQMAFNTTPHASFGISLNRDGSGQTSLFIGNGSGWQTLDFRSGGRLYSQQWNHVAVERYNNAITIYHNGVAQGTTTAVMPTGFYSLFRYGTYNSGAAEPVVGYIQDYRVYSGVAKYKGGFDVPKPYTPVGIATWRAVPDTTANNFATLNSVEVIGSTGSGINKVLSNGNLTATTNGNPNAAVRGNFPVSSGKWYFEATNQSALGNISQNDGIGVVAPGAAGVNGTTLGGYAIVYRDGGGAFLGNKNSRSDPATGTHATYVAGDIIGVALDIDNRDVEFFKNGVSVATYSFPSHIGTDEEWVSETLLRQEDALIHHNFGQNPTFSGNTTAGTFTDSNGNGLFKYQPPEGFLALCEDNLPTPAIKNPGEHFKTVLYTGDGNSGRSITGVGFKPDLFWVKERTNTSGYHLFDSVRGAGLNLKSNATDAESAVTTQLLSFDNDGFSIGSSGSHNQDGENYVAWCWKAGGEAVTNTDGSIQSVVSVNQDAGFSIVSTNGSGTAGHGLNATPQFIISKRTTLTSDWSIQHHQMMTSSTGKLLFSSAGVVTSSTPYMFNANDTTFEPVYTDPSINYCWAEIEGYSKFGSYVGNGSTDGPFVYCGFKPAWVMIKRTDSTGNWVMHDNARNSTNPAKGYLIANSSGIEEAGSDILDFLSNGFKIRNSWTDINASDGTIIFAAFAESPFQYANSK
jgi:hypothetical protein